MKTTKLRKVSPKQARKNAWQREREEAGLPRTRPAEKAQDLVPPKAVVTICRMCSFQEDCEFLDPAKISCPDFIRLKPVAKVEILETEPKPGYDLSHLNRKANGAAQLRNSLLKQYDFHRQEMRRLEREIDKLDKDIHKLAVAKTVVPTPTADAKRFFKESVAAERPKTSKEKVDYSAIEIDL